MYGKGKDLHEVGMEAPAACSLLTHGGSSGSFACNYCASPVGMPGWVYLAWFDSDAPALSDIHYVRYEPDTFLIKL